MVRIKVWHKEKHSNHTVTEIELLKCVSANDWKKQTISCGGFWKNSTTFIPWHAVTELELETK